MLTLGGPNTCHQASFAHHRDSNLAAYIAMEASNNIKKLSRKIRGLSSGPWLAHVGLLLLKVEDDIELLQHQLRQQSLFIASYEQEKEFRERQLFDKVEECEVLSAKFEGLAAVTHPARVQKLIDEAKAEVQAKHEATAELNARAVVDVKLHSDRRVKEAEDRATAEVTEGMKRNIAAQHERDQMWLAKNRELQRQVEEQKIRLACHGDQQDKAMLALKRKYEAQLEKNKAFAKKMSNARKLLV